MKTAHYCFFVCLPLFVGCSSMYIPSPKNPPLFDKKGEILAEAGASTNSIFATGSYAFSEKYALIANGSLSFRNFSKMYDLGTDWANPEFNILAMPSGNFAHYSFEAGLGRYNLLPSSGWRLEMFTGAGYGNANEYEDWKRENRYLQGFVQTNLGRKSKHFEIGMSLRLAGSYFDHKYSWDDECYDQKLGVAHIEYLLFMRYGWERFKIFFRGGANPIVYPLPPIYSYDYNPIWSSRGSYWNFTMFHLSTGVSFRF